MLSILVHMLSILVHMLATKGGFTKKNFYRVVFASLQKMAALS